MRAGWLTVALILAVASLFTFLHTLIEGDSMSDEQDQIEPVKAEEQIEEEKKSEVAKITPEEGDKVIKGNVLIIGDLRLMSADKKSSITLSVRNGMAGLWLESTSKNDQYPRSTIAIYEHDNGPCIGFYRDIGEENLAMTCAICLQDGVPCIQVPNGRGGYGFINLTEILDKVKENWR